MDIEGVQAGAGFRQILFDEGVIGRIAEIDDGHRDVAQAGAGLGDFYFKDLDGNVIETVHIANSSYRKRDKVVAVVPPKPKPTDPTESSNNG